VGTLGLQKFWGLFVVLLCAASLCASASASQSGTAPKCSELLVRSHPVKGGGAKLKAAVPGYDAQQDMMFFFHGGAHASLYVGNYYWDHWGVGEGARITVHPDPQVIPHGILVRVRIGRDRVQALESTISQGRTPLAHTLSCHLNQLAFLQRHGIFLSGGPKLLGTTTLRAVLEKGFVALNGESLPTQEIVTIEGMDKDLSSRIPGSLHHYPLDNVALFFSMFGLSLEEMLQQVEANTHSAEALALTTAIRNSGQQPLSEQQQQLLNEFCEELEARALATAEAKYQASLRELLELLAYHPQGVPIAELQQVLRQAIRESLR
jgi:hypothetical protein